jgi:hypothetical protein
MKKIRTHKKNIEDRRKLSPQDIRKNKCERTKLRNATRKVENMEVQQRRLNQWRSLSLDQQLTALAKRPGQSKKQRERIHAAIEASDTSQVVDESSKPQRVKTRPNRRKRKA